MLKLLKCSKKFDYVKYVPNKVFCCPRSPTTSSSGGLLDSYNVGLLKEWAQLVTAHYHVEVYLHFQYYYRALGVYIVNYLVRARLYS